MTDTEKAALERRIDELCQENERLRALADGAANETDRLTHDAAALQIENAKLRELLGGLEYCVGGFACDCCPLYDPSGTNHRRCESLERELGIEVTRDEQ
jgi:hypothetical protein